MRTGCSTPYCYCNQCFFVSRERFKHELRSIMLSRRHDPWWGPGYRLPSTEREGECAPGGASHVAFVVVLSSFMTTSIVLSREIRPPPALCTDVSESRQELVDSLEATETAVLYNSGSSGSRSEWCCSCPNEIISILSRPRKQPGGKTLEHNMETEAYDTITVRRLDVNQQNVTRRERKGPRLHT